MNIFIREPITTNTHKVKTLY